MSKTNNDSPQQLAVIPDGKQTSGTFGNEDADQGDRDRWPSRAAFYLAAVGSAVGFGNVWRFPALAKDYGGGAFFVPYLMALFLVGLPVLILEISLGQVKQTGNIGVFGAFHKRLRGVGMASVACAFVLVVYYSMLLSWVSRAFFESWSAEAPWTKEGVTGEEAVGYFMNDIIGMSTLTGDLLPTRLIGPNVGYSVLVWVSIWACLAFGLKWTGRIAYVSMGLPILLLFVFMGKACTLAGASDGIAAYIGQWDMAVLTERPDVWSTAVSQIFFSLSVTFGTMTAYGSHCPRGEPAFVNSVVVGISNSMFSIISGLAVFAAMGHLAFQQGVGVDEVPYKSFSLVFGTWPVVFGTLPGGAHWVRLLFFDLFLLGIDSAFSLLEGPLTVALDYFGHDKFPKWKMSAIFCFTAFVLSLIYATDAGLIFLDAVDFYLNFVLLLLGFFESFGAGWVYGIEEQISRYGPEVVFVYMFTSIGSFIVASGVWFGFDDADTAVWAGFLTLFVCYAVGMAVTMMLLSHRKESMQRSNDEWWSQASWGTIMKDLYFGNVFALRDELSSVVGYMPKLWAVLMKQVIPQILMILFINLAATKRAGTDEPLFGNYEGYVTWPFQVLGFLLVAFCSILILVGVAMPVLFEDFDLPARAIKEGKVADFTKHGGSDIEQGSDESSEKAASSEEAEA